MTCFLLEKACKGTTNFRNAQIFLAIFIFFFVILQSILQNMRISDPKIENPVLRMVGEEADKLGLECYVIGGWVRDLFLHRPSDDIDVVVVGSGIALAEAVAKRLGKKAHLSVFKTYGTAQVKWREARGER